MTKEDKQIIDRAVKEEWRIGDRTRLKRLLEKNLEQYRDKVELENKIADIKANCDLAIEVRDVKIKELELELTVEKDQHQEEINLHLHAEEYIKSLEKENAELEHTIAELRRDKDNLNTHTKAQEKLSEYHSDQLTKAKEIIREIMKFDIPTLDYEKAEQFLKGENIILEDVQAGNSPFDADEVFNKEIKAYPEEK